MINQITSPDAPAAIGPYSHAIDTGTMIFASGQLPLDATTGTMPEGAAAQTAQSLTNVKAVLAAAGVGMDAVVKTTVYLADMADFGAMNEVYEGFFAAPFPARSCFQVARLPKDAAVEIEVVAIRG